MTPPNGEPYFDYCGVIAKIIIQIINPILKDHPHREWYFKSQTYLAPLINGNDLGELAKKSVDDKYPWNYVKQIVEMHVDLNQYWPCITYTELMILNPCEVVSDNGALNTICDKVLQDNPKSIADFKKGKNGALNHLKGQVMKETKGKADMSKVETILREKMI